MQYYRIKPILTCQPAAIVCQKSSHVTKVLLIFSRHTISARDRDHWCLQYCRLGNELFCRHYGVFFAKVYFSFVLPVDPKIVPCIIWRTLFVHSIEALNPYLYTFFVLQHNMWSILKYIPWNYPAPWRDIGLLPYTGIPGSQRLHQHCCSSSCWTSGEFKFSQKALISADKV